MHTASAGIVLGSALLFLGFSAAARAAHDVSSSVEPAQGASIPVDSSAPRLTRADLESWLDGLIPYALDQGDIAGAMVLVIKDGEILLQKGYGYADVATRSPMDPARTIVGVGSVSKTFAWTAVMQQVEQGRLDLDRDINEYLDFEIPATFAEPVTLRHLMTHTAGFEERNFKQYAAPRPLGEHLRSTPVPDRLYPPGAVPAYSNYGTMLAGYIVERVSAEPFVDYIERHILRPLAMHSSTFRRPIPPQLRRNVATDYARASGEPMPPNNEEPAGDPSGHLVTTPSDISHFMLAHLQGGRHGDFQLLRPETLQRMHTTSFVLLPGAPGITLGFFRTDDNERQVIRHGGDISGFHADMTLLPEDGIGFFSVVNSTGASRGAAPAAIALRAALFRGFMDRYFPVPPLPEEATAATASEHARLAAGEYRRTRRYDGNFMAAVSLITQYFAGGAIIRANDDGTIETPALLNPLGRAQTWREVRPFVWREVGGRAVLNMKVEDGRVQAFWSSDQPPWSMNERVPLVESASLNVPLLTAAAGVLVLTTLLWPLAAAVRRHYGRTFDLAGQEARAYQLSRVAAAVGVLFLAGWGVLLRVEAADREGFEGWIRFVQSIGLLCVGGTVIAAWNTWLTWRSRRSAGSKACSVLLTLALAELVWFSLAFGLISLDLDY